MTTRVENQLLYLVLPYPPSVNGLYVPVAKGRLVLSEAGRDYRSQVGWQALAIYRETTDGEIVEYPVAVQMEVYRPRKRGDLSNLIKVIEDSLTGVVYKDDDQIIEEHLFRADDPANPRVEVTLWRAS